MMEESEIKVSKSYSLDPKVIAWVTQKAARLTMEGQRTSDSTLVNDILTAAMEEDRRKQGQDKELSHQTTTEKKSRRAQAAPIAA